MRWKDWKDKYESIVERLNLDPEMDREAAKILGGIMGERDISGLRGILKGNDCIVLGAGPSLVEDLERLSSAGWLDKVVLSADGATSAVMEYKNPDVIVTDLDGNIEDQVEAWEKGAWMAVHGHGDNIRSVKKVAPMLDERAIGTIQVNEPTHLYNFGGFTDGDRAAFLAHELGATEIYLAGMDLGEKIGEYTGETEKEQKLVKLEICEELLTWLVDEFDANLANLTAGDKDIPRVPTREIA